MQHVEGSGMPVLYIGRTVLKVNRLTTSTKNEREDSVLRRCDVVSIRNLFPVF